MVALEGQMWPHWRKPFSHVFIIGNDLEKSFPPEPAG
jgi:hypothetical protein